MIDCIIVVYDKGQSCNRQPEIYTVSHSESHQKWKTPSVMLNKQRLSECSVGDL